MPTAPSPTEALPGPPSVKLYGVDPRMVDEFWPLVRPLIEHAIKRGGLSSFAPVENAVLSGQALLWLATDLEQIYAAAVTELHQSEWRKVCVIVACGGQDVRRWLPLLSGLEQYAKKQNCTAMRIMGRKGWTSMLPDYEVRRVVLEKDLS